MGKLKFQKANFIKRADSNKKAARIYFPSSWLREMGITEDNPGIVLEYKDTRKKGKRIIVRSIDDYDDDELEEIE